MQEIPQELIAAIRTAGITVAPEHASFQNIARRVWVLICREAAQVREAVGGREASIRSALIAEVRAAALGPLYQIAGPDQIEQSLIVFSAAVRSGASAIITEHNRGTRRGEADAPPPSPADYKPIRGRKPRKRF